MKKFSRMIGVTLLEVMLVLAVAAMIIVMSIRYYQTATTNQQVNATLSQIQAIVAAADSLMQGSGNYSSVNTAAIKALMPNQVMESAWAGAITVAGSGQAFDVEFVGAPAAVCAQVVSRLAANTQYSGVGSCPATGNGPITFTYNSTPQ